MQNLDQKIEEILLMCAKNTERAYRKALRDFREYGPASESTAIQYAVDLKAKHSPGTMRLRLHGLCSIYSQLFKRGIIKSNPFYAIPKKLFHDFRQVRPTARIPIEKIGEIINKPSEYTADNASGVFCKMLVLN